LVEEDEDRQPDTSRLAHALHPNCGLFDDD
jgi:hypothetical protein